MEKIRKTKEFIGPGYVYAPYIIVNTTTIVSSNFKSTKQKIKDILNKINQIKNG